MKLSGLDQFLIGWFGLANVVVFFIFGYDKWEAGRKRGQRVSEATLCLTSALGGWLGGFCALFILRHKSAKPSFQLKFAAAFFIWVALIAGAVAVSGRW